MQYLAPSHLDEALAALSAGRWKLLAGGTDFYPGLRDRPVEFDTLDISRIAALRGIARTDAGWRIGALTSWTEIVRAKLPPAFDGLKAAAREVGAIQIQNAGTIGGNLCNASPAADGVPPLLCLNAAVEIGSQAGTRVLALGDFITGVRRTERRDDEIVTAILVPKQPDNAVSRFEKLGARRYLVISIAMASMLVVVDDNGRISEARIAVGACSPVARRLTVLENDLVGLPIDRAALSAAVRPQHLAALSPIADVRGSAEYRLEAVAEILTRMLCRLAPKDMAA